MGGEFPGPDQEGQPLPPHLQTPDSRGLEAAREAGDTRTAAEAELERQQRFTSPEGRAQDMMREAARRDEPSQPEDPDADAPPPAAT